MKLYDNIRNRRKELGLSQDELAKKVGYKDRTSIAKIESGKVDISEKKIYLFAQALNMDPVDLMGVNTPPSPQDGHYIDPEVAELAEEARTNPELRILFSAAKNISKKDMQKTIEFVKFLKSQERNDSDFSE